MEFQELDQYYKNVLTLCFSKYQGIGYNELFKLGKEVYGLTRPTLSFHLKHLQKIGIIERVENKNSSLKLKPVTYRINFKTIPKNLQPIDELYNVLNQQFEAHDFDGLSTQLLKFTYERH